MAFMSTRSMGKPTRSGCTGRNLRARKCQDFERYARALGGIIPRCGGELVGYWLPTKFAGPTNSALALINFPNLAAYEPYRERLAKDNDDIDSVRRVDESGCILEDRAVLERV
jgi:NIPSNAP